MTAQKWGKACVISILCLRSQLDETPSFERENGKGNHFRRGEKSTEGHVHGGRP